MQTFHEIARDIPVVAEYDVVVAGGGPAGIGAAIGAAREGAKTIIIDDQNALGGMAIPGGMSHWVGTSSSSVYREILRRCRADKWPMENDIDSAPHIINHEKQKLVILDLMAENKVDVLLRTHISGAMMDGNKVCGVIIENKSGRSAIAGKVVIDCTGDGDVACSAGVEFQLGREEDNKMQPVTLMFKIGGVDFSRAVFPGSFETLVDTPKGELQSLARKILPHPAGHVLLYPSTINGLVVVNMTNQIDIDATDGFALSRAEIACARQIPKIIDFLREYAPGYEKCYPLNAAANVGVRETRHFKGEYTLTAEDIVEARVFDDWITTRNAFNFDIHNLDGAGLDKNGAQRHFKAKGQYTIPYRCSLPLGVEGLLLAGRNISGTHKAHSNYRVMPICAGIGEGCGVAAALAVKHHLAVRLVDVHEIQQVLAKYGVEV